MSMGQRIKQARDNKKLTRELLAQMLGVTVSAISNYENDISTPKEPILISLMSVLEVDANYLFQDEYTKAKNTPEAEAAEVSEEDQKIAILLKGLTEDNKHKAREYLDFLKSKQNQ